jgi:hypothetical protein
MKVEYRKKEISWCLDRETGQICLTATVVDNRIITLRITSENFQVDIANSEIDSFMNLLETLTEGRVPESPLETITEPTKALDIPFTPESEPIPSELFREDFSSKPADRFTTHPPDKPQSHEEASIPEETLPVVEDPISTPMTKVFDQKTDVASFFGVHQLEADQVPEEKSPLELLLEEETEPLKYGPEITDESSQSAEDTVLYTEADVTPEEEVTTTQQSLEDLALHFSSISEKLVEDTPLDTAHTEDLLEKEAEFDQELEDDTATVHMGEDESHDRFELPPMPPLEESSQEDGMEEEEEEEENNKKPSTSRRAELNRLLWELTRGY